MLAVEFGGRTDAGRKRKRNEDNFVILEKHHMIVVADGMGGHACGEVASATAVSVVREFLEALDSRAQIKWPFEPDFNRDPAENRLLACIKLANQRIRQLSREEEKYAGLGTTVVALYITEQEAWMAHVGDSRVYRLREGRLQHMTRDHSLLNEYADLKKLSAEEMAEFPHKNVIVRALGSKDDVLVDIAVERTRPGDIFMLCSDGLHGPVKEPELLRIMNENSTDMQAMCDRLVEQANKNGGPDNITACALRILSVR